MNTTSTIALPAASPASSGLPAASLIARLAHALRSLSMRFATQSTEPDFMAPDPKDLIHGHLPEHPAEKIRREAVDRVLASCPYLR